MRTAIAAFAATISFLTGCMDASFSMVGDRDAFTALADRAVVYEGTTGAGSTQSWSSDGTSIFDGNSLLWKIENGLYCSVSEQRDWDCWVLSVSEDGALVRFGREGSDGSVWIGRYSDI